VSAWQAIHGMTSRTSRNSAQTRFATPVQAAEHEAEHLHQIVDEGKSEATPAILIGAWIAFVVPLVAIVIAIAFGTAYLTSPRFQQRAIPPSSSIK
jgi:hypothetical protein